MFPSHDQEGSKAAKPQKGRRGGAQPGAGRPRNITQEDLKNLDPYDSSATLKKMGYDPIIETIKAIKEIDKEIKWMKSKAKPSMPAIAQLRNTKRALTSDLLRFGYRPIPEKTVQETHFKPIDILLTDEPAKDVGLETVPVVPEDISDVDKAEKPKYH